MIIEIPKILENNINQFIKLNNIQDSNSFILNCLRDGFNIAKYGYSPKDNFEKENKPFKEIKYVDEEEQHVTVRVEEDKQRENTEFKKQSSKKEDSKSNEEAKENVKKRKIRIINSN